MNNGDSGRSMSGDGSHHGSENGHSPRPAGRSRSRSNEGRRFRKRSSRSQSGSPKRSRRSSPGRRDFRSRGSPSGGRRDKKQVDRENPAPGRCLGVFGLSIHTREHHLKEVFTKYGNLDKVQIVYDAQTGRSRGFAFVYFENKNDAGEAKDRCNGIDIDGRKIRVDFSVTQRAHTPTPGIYMGRPTQSHFRGESGGGYRGGGGGGYRSGGGGGYGGGGRRSPSPYGYRERRSTRYSRSRSHSPRRHHR